VTRTADSGLFQVVVAQENLNGTQIGAGTAYPGAGIASALAIHQTFRCVPFRSQALELTGLTGFGVDNAV
jgi:hypothetical protein